MFIYRSYNKKTLLGEVSPQKRRVCWRGLNRSVHEGKNDVSNGKVHSRTRSGNVNMLKWLLPVTDYCHLDVVSL